MRWNSRGFQFADRRDAGRALAAVLGSYAHRADVIVLGLPRGGVPVAAEVAHRLHAPLDVWLVRKLGVPGYEELAMGAIASGGVVELDRDRIADLRISDAAVREVVARERMELERRERAYRCGRAPIEVRGKTVILVDDGLATGSTMRAAATALRRLSPKAIIAAAPVASRTACADLAAHADACVCVAEPPGFRAVGEWYADFDQTSDAEVIACLEESAENLAADGAAPIGGPAS